MKPGTFSVRSAYHREWANGQGSTNLNLVWKGIWKLRVLGKFKISVRRVLRGALPCLGVLADKHIATRAQCPVCWFAVEDIQHCLFSCQRAKEVWKALGLKEEVHKVVLLDRSGSVTMESLIHDNSPRAIEENLMIEAHNSGRLVYLVAAKATC